MVLIAAKTGSAHLERVAREDEIIVDVPGCLVDVLDALLAVAQRAPEIDGARDA